MAPTDAPSNPFALPRGPLGHVAGWLMARGNEAEQHEVADLLDVPVGARILEVGFGPGRLVRLLAARFPTALISGVDPSATMLGQATRANRAATAGGRVELRQGDAAHLPYPDRSFDRVLAVNSIAIWPDLGAGVDEIARVLCPGGTLVVAWHSAHSPSRMARRLRLSECQLCAIEQALAGRFGGVCRRDLPHVVAFLATRLAVIRSVVIRPAARRVACGPTGRRCRRPARPWSRVRPPVRTRRR
ncbi:MAG: class I SAM-dependent methyltransferase [Carbonactinosporaceae bacterium]